MSRDLILVAFSMFIWGLGEATFLEFRSLYLEQLGANPVVIGSILGTAGVVMALSHIPAGFLADRFGRRPVMWAGWMIGSSAACLMAMADRLTFFVFGLLLYRVTTFVMAPINSYITAARGKWSVGRAITVISACFNLGAVIGPSVGGLIGDRVGLRGSFGLAAGLFLFSTLIVLFIRPQPLEEVAPRSDLKKGVLDKRFLIFMLVVFLAMFAMYLPQPLAANFLQNQRGLGLLQIGQLLSIASLGIVVLHLVLGQMNANLGFILGQAAVVVFAISLWRGSGFPWYMLGYFMLGGYRTGRALATAQARDLIGASQMGLAYGMAETVGGAAMILAPPLAGYLYTLEPTSIYPVSVGLLLFSIGVSIWFRAGQLKKSAVQVLSSD